MTQEKFDKSFEDEDGFGESAEYSDTPDEELGDEWEKEEETTQPVTSGSEFDCEAGSASTSTGSEKSGGETYAKQQNLVLNHKSGAFGMVEKAPEGSKGRKFDVNTFENEEGTPCKGMKVFVGDGQIFSEDRGHYRKSQIFLSEPKVAFVNEALQQIGCQKTIGKFISAYGDCTGGIKDVEIPVSLYDTIVAGAMKNASIVRWGKHSINLKEISDRMVIDWKHQDGRDHNPLFREAAMKPTSKKLPNSHYYIHVDKFQPVPDDIEISEMPDDVAGRMLKFTDWASRSFTLLEKALAAGYAIKQQVDVLDVLTGKSRGAFDKWMQNVVLHVTTGIAKTKSYGDFTHPRFWAAVKKDRVVNGEVRTEGLGLSIYETMKTREFAIAMKQARNARPYSDERVEEFWLETCGDRAIFKKDGRTVIVKDNAGNRKKAQVLFCPLRGAFFAMSNLFYETIEGQSRFKFGKFKGVFLKDVPDWYMNFMVNLWEPDCDDEDMQDFIDLMKDNLTGGQNG